MSTTSSTTPSGTQANASQASGSPVTPPAASTASTGATGATGTTGTTGTTEKKAASTTTKLELPSWMRDLSAAITDLGGPATLISYVWLLVFHLGAAMLSYHKYGSPMWALLAFVFAVFYYPYYALVLDAPVAAPAPLIGMGKSRRR